VKFQVVLERDTDSGHVTATVPAIPGIIVDAPSEEEALAMARDAIVFWREENREYAAEHVQATIATVEA
jgi:predicted RNase H-like HicB family nuclease